MNFYRKVWISIGWYPYKLIIIILIGCYLFWAPEITKHIRTFAKSTWRWFHEFLSEGLNFYRVSLVQLLCFRFGRIFLSPEHLRWYNIQRYSWNQFENDFTNFYRKAWISIGWHPYKLIIIILIGCFLFSAAKIM